MSISRATHIFETRWGAWLLPLLLAATSLSCSSAADATGLPGSGNFVSLKSDAGDSLGGGKTYLYTPANATFIVESCEGCYNLSSPAVLGVRIDGSELWFGSLSIIGSSDLRPGTYSLSQPANESTGFFSWLGAGRECGTSTSTVTIASATYTERILTAIDMRFEQHCNGAGPALHGIIRWSK